MFKYFHKIRFKRKLFDIFIYLVILFLLQFNFDNEKRLKLTRMCYFKLRTCIFLKKQQRGFLFTLSLPSRSTKKCWVGCRADGSYRSRIRTPCCRVIWSCSSSLLARSLLRITDDDDASGRTPTPRMRRHCVSCRNWSKAISL